MKKNKNNTHLVCVILACLKNKKMANVPFNLVAAVGFEPTTLRVWTARYNQLSYAAIKLVVPRGIEPLTPPWKGDVLTSWPWDQNKMVAGAGFEPATFGLWARRASELLHPATNNLKIKAIIFYLIMHPLSMVLLI